MTYREFRRLLIDADECETFEQYLAETENAAYNLLADVWKLHDSHTYRTMVEISGISNRQIAVRYGIPIRTAENWHIGKREIAPYLLDLMAADVLSDKYKS